MSTNLPVKQHATLGASTSARWMACPGSIRLIDSLDLPDGSGDSGYAREGTAAHALAEWCITNNTEPHQLLGVQLGGVEVTEEMADFVSIFVDYCRSLAQTASESFSEQRFSLAKLNPPEAMFGTADFVAYDKAARTLHVVDLKYGRGVVVEVKENEQLRYYALGAALMLDDGTRAIERVEMTIVQPRAAHPDGIIRSEQISIVDLVEWANDLLAAARATQEPNAQLVAGEHCRFCPAAATCPARLAQAQAIARVEFEALPTELPKPESLSLDVLVNIMTNLDMLEDYFASVRQFAQTKLERGESVPGLKLVAKRAMRKWSDEDAVRAELGGRGFDQEDVEVSKLKSPAQMEKVVGKKNAEAWLGPHIVKVSSGYNVVPESDPREGIQAPSALPALPPAE